MMNFATCLIFVSLKHAGIYICIILLQLSYVITLIAAVIWIVTVYLLKMAVTSLPPFRLPLDIIPKHYDLDIITNLEPDNFSFEGSVWIKVS